MPEASGPEPIVSRPFPAHRFEKGAQFSAYLRTTDHKVIGRMYMVTSLSFFAVGGILALLMRAELARPGMQFLSPEQYNQLLTMHGTVMLLFFATPIVFAFANLVLPLQIGSPDVAFPRLNAFSYWLFLFGAVMAMSGFVTPGGAADAGWTMYTPLSDDIDVNMPIDLQIATIRRGAERLAESLQNAKGKKESYNEVVLQSWDTYLKRN